MASPNQQLEPTPFEPAAAPPTRNERPAGGPPTWVWPAFGGLLLLALLVIFWLPDQVAERPAAPAPVAESAAPQQGPATRPAEAAPAPEASPWSDAQSARLRKEAQEVLQQLLDLQFTLEERSVQRWAPEAFAEGAALARAGDELYRQRNYIAARKTYQRGLVQMQTILDGLPAAMEAQLELARGGIEQGLPEQADAAVELAALIEPENAELAGLQQRADTLRPLLTLLAAAAEAEAAGDLAAAEAKLKQASHLDPQHQRAATELARVSGAYRDQQFNDAMSDGYSALDEGRYRDAREYFQRAAALRPGSSEAANALQEVSAGEQSSQLSALQREGARLERAEQWQQAVETYERAIATDPSLRFAVEGLERSRARARLDKQFRSAIEQPERLSDVAVAETMDTLLQQARATEPRGPLLQQQVATLGSLLQQANTLVPLTLRSDGETEVIVYKVARLGRFQQRELRLRPGTYRVRGSRVGYRDVLEQVTIRHDQTAPQVTVACTERIL